MGDGFRWTEFFLDINISPIFCPLRFNQILLVLRGVLHRSSLDYVSPCFNHNIFPEPRHVLATVTYKHCIGTVTNISKRETSVNVSSTAALFPKIFKSITLCHVQLTIVIIPPPSNTPFQTLTTATKTVIAVKVSTTASNFSMSLNFTSKIRPRTTRLFESSSLFGRQRTGYIGLVGYWRNLFGNLRIRAGMCCNLFWHTGTGFGSQASVLGAIWSGWAILKCMGKGWEMTVVAMMDGRV